MEFTFARDEDLTAVRSLWDICFGDSAAYTDIFFSHVYKTEGTVLAKDGSSVIGSLQFFPHTVYAEGRKIPGMYIGGVDVLPAYRGKGIATKLMTYTENHLRKKGIELLFLVPASARIYRGMGYDCISYLSTISGPMSALSPFLSKNTHSLSATASPVPAYTAFAKQFPVYLERDEKRFTEEIFPLSEAECYVLNKTDGYILFTIKSNTFQGLECAYKDSESFRQILRFVYDQYGHLEKFSLCVPADGKVRKVLSETTITETRFLHAMAKSLSSSPLTEKMENYINMIGWV